jgi:serine/threonine protein kinase
MIDNKFALSELMGVGGSSKVYSAYCQDGTECALKIIRKDKGYSEELSRRLVQNESLVMTDLGDHPNLVNSFGCNPDGIAQLADGQHEIRYLVLEKCKNGSLSTIIRHTGPLEEFVAKFLFIQLCYATQHVHNKNYAHLDIKLENILLDDFFNAKLADLGTAVNVEASLGFTNKRRGTPQYMAPEIKNKKGDEMIDATIADVYSLGVCLHLLLTGEFPCEDSFESNLSSLETESSGDPTVPESNKRVKARMQYLSEEARDLLEEMLEENAFFRLSIDEVLQHPWLKDASFDGIHSVVYEEMSNRLDFVKSCQAKASDL